MSHSILVTIAIPAYKSRYLKDAIESVLQQTYKNIELIIVNDNSPEDIFSVVSLYDDNRIKYYCNEINIGGKDPVKNWNKCLSYASGEFFSLLCDDDVYEPRFIEKMIGLAAKYPNVNVFRSRVKVIDKNGDVKDIYPSVPEYETTINYIVDSVSGYRRQTISEFMLRTSYIRLMNGYFPLPKAWFSDYISIFKFSYSNGIATSNELLVAFRESDINISSNNSKNVKEKLNATILYSKVLSEIIMNEPENIKYYVANKRKRVEQQEIKHLLSISSLRDFFFFIRKRNEYHINSYTICNSVQKRIILIIRRFFKIKY